MIGEQTGATKPRAIPLPSKAFFSAPAWSPDGKQLLLEDNHLNLWSIDVATGTATKIDTDTYDDPGRRFDAVWSPDSRWVAYSKSLDQPPARDLPVLDRGQEGASGHRRAVGCDRAGVRRGGKYLYFLASTNYALRTGWLEMSSVDRPVTRAIYLAVLSASEPSPLLPETGDEPSRRQCPRRRRRRSRDAAKPQTAGRSASTSRASVSGFWRSRFPPATTAR